MEGHDLEGESPTPKKEVKLFGRNIATMPCFRNSLICGICTGVAGGLIAFMWTSKALVSSHTAFASLWVGVFVYWIPCRYKYESSMLMAQQWKKVHKVKMIEKEEKKKQDPKQDAPVTSSEEDK